MIEALVLAWLLAHGYGPVQRDVVFYAVQTESGFRPQLEGRHKGLLQWAGARRRALAAYEAVRVPQLMIGDTPDVVRLAEAEAQLEFMAAEWRQDRHSAGFFAARDVYSGWQVFCRHFLRRRRC